MTTHGIRVDAGASVGSQSRSLDIPSLDWLQGLDAATQLVSCWAAHQRQLQKAPPATAGWRLYANYVGIVPAPQRSGTQTVGHWTEERVTCQAKQRFMGACASTQV